MAQSNGTGFQFQTQFTDHMSQLGKLTRFLFPLIGIGL
jgi:hypothetical protein